MKQILCLLILSFPLVALGQECDCESNFNWVRKTFEENDAGFAFVIENKGNEAYEQHNQVFAEKVKSINNSAECAQTIYDWLTFFRSGHIAIRRLNQQGSQNSNEKNDEETVNEFKDWEKLEVDVPQFIDYLESKEKNDYEGVWVSEPYEIGIKKVGTKYLGFIIKADGVYWSEGQVKLEINEDHSSTYYMRDHSPQNFDAANLLGENYLEIGFISLKRKTPTLKTESNIERYFNAISARSPYFEEINEATTLLRIPRFQGSEKKKIDSVIIANKDKILQSPNLIIDLRNNGGGSDESFEELLPLLYTNPIRTVGVELLSTPLNNQRMLDFINKEEYGFNEEGKKWAKESYDKLSKHIGTFVMLNKYPITETTFDTVYPFPKNIGIIINENNGSTTEQFLLAAKQSKKVKLFGTTTVGVLDISNMYFVKSPCAEFELGYCLSKSMRIPDMTIDNKGIQPDYYIDKEIPKYEWIKYVTEILNE